MSTLGTAILTLMLQGEDEGGDALAAQLLDLLGDAAFERVGELMERRWALGDGGSEGASEGGGRRGLGREAKRVS